MEKLKCPLVDAWIKKLWLKQWDIIQSWKGGKSAFVTVWMDLEDTTLRDISQEKQILYHLACMENLNK